MASKDETLFIRYVFGALGQSFLQDLLMVLAIHFWHQLFDLLIPNLESLIAENTDSSRICLSYLP